MQDIIDKIPREALLKELTKERFVRKTNNGDNQSHAVEHVTKDVYRHICQELVLPDILSKYMTDTIPSIERMMQFRKMFASQLSSNSVIQHAFAVIERTPMRFVFCNRTGKVLAQDFRFQYNQGNHLDSFFPHFALLLSSLMYFYLLFVSTRVARVS